MVMDRERTIERALSVPAGEETQQLKELFAVDGTLLMKSELPPGLIIPIARGYILADITKSKILANYCIPGDEKVLAKNRKGLAIKNIQKMSEGEELWTLNERTLNYEFDKIKTISERVTEEVVELGLSNGDSIRATSEHPFAIFDKKRKLRWVSSEYLKTGDLLFNFRNRFVKIISKNFSKVETLVYDYQMENNHNFFANGILVKNCDLILRAQISKDRKGRLELMEALVAGRRHVEDEDF